VWERRISARELIWDARRSLLYVPTSAADTVHPTSLVAIDPVTESQVFVLPLEGELERLTFSSDGAALYGLARESATIQRIDLETRTVSTAIAFGVDGRGEPVRPVDFGVVPGRADTLVVTTRASSAAWEGTTVYDGPVARPETLRERLSVVVPAWDGRVVYADDGLSVQELSIHSRGISLQRRAPDTALGSGAFLEGRLLFTRHGAVIDPIELRQIGRYEIDHPFAPEAATQRTYVASFRSAPYPATGQYLRIRVLDRERFVELRYEDVPIPRWRFPQAVVRWGTRGIAALAHDEPAAPTSEAPSYLLVLISDIVEGPP